MNPDGFLADVLDEPRTLAAVLDAFAADPPPVLEPGRVVLIGMGSSRYAALTAATALRARGIDAVAEYASTGVPVVTSTILKRSVSGSPSRSSLISRRTRLSSDLM